MSSVAALMPYRTNAPKIIPIIPARTVKNTDSKMICDLTSEGVAPSALLIPISLVRSLTEISNILPIPITPANIVAIPTTSDKKVSPLAKFIVFLNTSPRLNPPIARSSSGSILWICFKVDLIFFSTSKPLMFSSAATIKKETSSPVLNIFLKVAKGM